jgi:prolipoprotein diacylglyceryl transferase
VNTNVLAPLSIPSPPYDWQAFTIPFGQWLHGIIPAIPETQALTIRTYAIAILIGIVAAVILTQRRLTARGAERGIVIDIAIWAVPFGIIGARIFHVLTHPDDYFGAGKDLWEIIRIDHGGIAIFGGLIGGLIGSIIACRLAGLRLTAWADALAPGLLLAQAFGRVGNYFNHELYGQPTDLPWGLEIESSNPAYPIGLPDGTLFHPTFLYEILWNLLGVVVILLIEREWRLQKKTIFGISLPVPTGGRVRFQWGKLIAVYLIWYGLGRTVWETIRVDPSEIFFGIRTNVWAALFAIALGVLILVVQSRRHYGLEPGPYVPGRGPNAVVDSAETYSDTEEPSNDAKPKSGELVPAAAKTAVAEPATSGKGKKS